jgi:lipoprotein NlpI
MRITLILFFAAIVLSGCSKMEEKKQNQTDNKSPMNNMQNPHTKGDVQEDTKNKSGDMTDMAPETSTDEKAEKLVKEADDMENSYKKNNTEQNKKELIEKHMAAGNYLMFEAKLSPKKKYGPALKQFKRVLELDPSNQDAMNNKAQIEDIYNSMGRPIPN